MIGVEQMATDLMETARFWNGFNEADSIFELFAEVKISVSIAHERSLFFLDGLLAGPRIRAGMSDDNCEVFFFDAILLKGEMEFTRDVAICGEDEDSRGRSIESMDWVNALANLIAEDLHRDLIIGLRVIRRDDHLPGGFVDGDDGVVLVEDVENHLLRRF